MACGCAFVGTDIGGFREFADPERNALLSPVGDSDALFANLVRVVDDASPRHRLSAAGLATLQAFTWKRSGDAMEAALAGEATRPS